MKPSADSKIPNFLIVGAARSGTTSIYHYLRQHPDIYMSPVKEPKFITSHFLKFPFQGIGDQEVERSIIKSFNDYCQLFKDVRHEKAIGEASADNLYYYEQSISYIKKYLGNPKIIIILRNPIERAYSAYLYLLRDKREFLSFEEALEKEEMRKKQNWEFIWFYKDVGFYYRQVKAYLENFKYVNVCLYDDLKNNPLQLVRKLYQFLNVDSSFTPDVNLKYNVSLIPKNRFLHKLLTEPNLLKKATKPFLRIFLTDDTIGKILDFLKEKNSSRPAMRPETKAYLKDLYHNDILKLQTLLNENLSHWLS